MKQGFNEQLCVCLRVEPLVHGSAAVTEGQPQPARQSEMDPRAEVAFIQPLAAPRFRVKGLVLGGLRG